MVADFIHFMIGNMPRGAIAMAAGASIEVSKNGCHPISCFQNIKKYFMNSDIGLIFLRNYFLEIYEVNVKDVFLRLLVCKLSQILFFNRITNAIITQSYYYLYFCRGTN